MEWMPIAAIQRMFVGETAEREENRSEAQLRATADALKRYSGTQAV